MDYYSYQINDKEIGIYRSICPHLNSNMYIILTANEAVVIDPCENEELLLLFDKNRIDKVHILLTHEHYDHVSGVRWFKEHYKTDVFCHRRCAEVVSSKRGSNPSLVFLVYSDMDKKDNGHRYQDFKDKFEPYPFIVDMSYEYNENLKIGRLYFGVTYTPGHCPGASCYKLFDKIVFTGDSLLQETPVILSFRESVKDDYEKITLPYLRSLAKDTIILPGHGDPFVLKDAKYL